MFNRDITLSDVLKEQDLMLPDLERLQAVKKKLVLIGPSGVGKTTLANHLCHVDLFVKSRSTDGHIFIDIDNGDGKETNIGSGADSCTTRPNFFYQDDRLAIVDCPGIYGETRHLLQTVKNAFYVQTVFNGRGHLPGINNFAFMIVGTERDIVTHATELRSALRIFTTLTLAPLRESIKGLEKHY